jgi:hypothetical protein
MFRLRINLKFSELTDNPVVLDEKQLTKKPWPCVQSMIELGVALDLTKLNVIGLLFNTIRKFQE